MRPALIAPRLSADDYRIAAVRVWYRWAAIWNGSSSTVRAREACELNRIDIRARRRTISGAADIGWYRGAMAGRRGVNERTSIQRRLERDCPEDTGRLYCDWLLRIATGASELQLHELPHA